MKKNDCIDKKCLYCKNVFTAKGSQRNKKKFCKTSCQVSANDEKKKDTILFNCKHCGFENRRLRASRIKNSGYCNDTCQTIHKLKLQNKKGLYESF